MLLDGALIPARLLVNGSTIVQETGLSSVQYFHIELDRHAILLAEGMPAESYLDTGNRAVFENGGAATVLHPEFSAPTALEWSKDACAPLAVAPSQAEPIWRRLADRAASLGFAAPEAKKQPENAAPMLEVDGTMLPGTASRPGHHLFALPPGGSTVSVRLRSAASRPSDRTPWLDDRRQLGMPVERILLHGNGEITELPLDHPGLAAGWWQAEREADRVWRWTDGNAAFPVPEGTDMIEILAALAEALPAAT